MNMIRIIIFFLSALLLTASGCKKYLQVRPTGAYTEDQVFSNEKAAQQAINGLYISMADNKLYGAALTQTYVELMAQRYALVPNPNKDYSFFPQYQYTATKAQAVFDGIWKIAYKTILTANVILSKIELSLQTRVLTQEQYNLMKGEALAVRAMLHFDMLRIFGPVYSLGANQPSIPYYAVADGKLQPILTSAEVLNKVLEDLTNAETLLANDPVIQNGVLAQRDFYTGLRNERINYYAVKALKARAYLWGGKKTEAHDAALAALNEGEKWFPWLPYTSIIGTTTPDRIFSTEVIFAVYNRGLYVNQTNTFSADLLDNLILAPDPTNLKNTFENNENDYRYASSWRQTLKSYRTFFKYNEVSQNQAWSYLQPLIRKTELYYILAETETDPATARGYLNAVRNKRGLQNLAANASLPTEIMKEYRKEFYGEGQLFFYYKRTNTAAIPDGKTNSPIAPVYIVPLPLSETTPR